MKIFIILAAILAIGASYALNLDKVKAPGNRIANGIEASTTDMPYQVGLFIKGINTPNRGGICGGALISETVVLTAAHCFINKQLKGFAFLGTNRFAEGTEVEFSRVTVHEQFSLVTGQNDIALVHLDEAVKPNGSTIKIIELDRNYLDENTEITVSGYGDIAEDVGTDKLFYTEMTIVNQKECGRVHSSMICAKGINGKETCPGDSGGPVVRNWPNNPTHVGLVSFGSGCEKGKPNVFTRTTSFIDWIEKNM